MTKAVEIHRTETYQSVHNLDPVSKVGVNIQDASSIEEAIEAAGLNWEVEKQQLVTENGIVIPNKKAVVRKDTNRVLGVVGSQYTPVQNTEAFKLYQPFFDSGELSFETAGSTGGGRRTFIQAKVNTDPVEIGNRGDLLEPFVLFATSHDGSLRTSFGFNFKRLWCHNMLNAGMNLGKNARLLKFRHTPKIHEGLETVAASMNLMTQEFNFVSDQYLLLNQVSLNMDQVVDYIKITMFGADYAVREESEGRVFGKQIVSNIIDLYNHGGGTNKTDHTMWRAYNAVNEYYSHVRGKDDQKRLDDIAFGSRDIIALENAIHIAKRIA